MENKDGNATDNGAQINGNGENGKVTSEEGKDFHKEENTPKTVPYSRFQEVNAKRKSAEDAIAGIAETISADFVPENFRALIPDLPPAEKIKWIFEARKQGFFNSGNMTSGPDAKRPISKPSVDLSSLSPVAMISQGFK